MSYERWCAMRGFGARLAGDTSPTAQERAKAKRARKAAKRRRDAERARRGWVGRWFQWGEVVLVALTEARNAGS